MKISEIRVGERFVFNDLIYIKIQTTRMGKYLKNSMGLDPSNHGEYIFVPERMEVYKCSSQL